MAKIKSKDEAKAKAAERGREKVTIKIPRPLYDKLKIIIKDSGYDSVTDFVVFVMRDLVASSSVSDQTNEGEVEKIKEKLKGLGYL